MANQAEAPSDLIGGCYSVDLSRPLPWAGAGITTFGATDKRAGHTDLMAQQVGRHAPMRHRAVKALLTTPIEGMLTPLAHGKGPPVGGDAGYYVITRAPPGPPLAARMQPWPESMLIELVLRPAAHALEALRHKGITHRAIRAENVFQAQPGQPVVLGAAWATPPALHQPALYEPPYSAMCMPQGRGNGVIGDDVYALGVLLIVLALGRVPLSGQDDAAIIRRKLELGSFAALAGDERLPAGVADLAGGMLAEDPEHRPPLKMLQDLAAARGRKVATRPPHRAQRALQVGDMAVWNTRTLAYAIAADPDKGLQIVLGITLMPWLRRGLGETAVAVRIEELLRDRAESQPEADVHADTVMMLHIIALIDPLAPLCWHGIALWPDGLGSALAHTQAHASQLVEKLQALIGSEAIATWAAQRPEHCDPVALRLDARQYRGWLQVRGQAGGLPRLLYMLNPALPCGGKLGTGRWVGELTDLLSALEAVTVEGARDADPVDRHIAAFIASHSDRRLDLEVNALNGTTDREGRLMAQLRLLSELQARFDTRPLPLLAGWFAGQAAPLVAHWRNRQTRASVMTQLVKLAEAGQLAPMLALIEEPGGRAADQEGAQRAALELAVIDAELAQIDNGGDERSLTAQRIGQELAAGIGLTALATLILIAALG